eukprot:1158680-Pelagomonas_calceolata.AAC.6
MTPANLHPGSSGNAGEHRVSGQGEAFATWKKEQQCYFFKCQAEWFMPEVLAEITGDASGSNHITILWV